MLPQVPVIVHAYPLMQLPELTPSTIESHTAGGSLERGREYADNGRVVDVRQAGEGLLEARVKGHQVHPYTVEIRFDADEITDVSCTCPYHAGTWCKHVVATLLTVRDRAVPKASRASVRKLLEDLDREALVELIVRLAEYEPQLVDRIQEERARIAGDAA